MTSELIGAPRHPVAAFEERLAEVGSMGLSTMSPEEKRESLLAIARSRAKADALYLRLLAEADASEATTTSPSANADPPEAATGKVRFHRRT